MKTLLLAASLCALPLFLTTTPRTSPDQTGQEKVEAQPATRKTQGTKDAKVRTLLELTNGSNMGEQLVDRMVMQFERMPQVPDGFIAKFKELAKPNEFIDMIVPIYAKKVEEKDLDAIIKFFRSGSGKRWLAAQPKIMRESQAIGMKWSRDLRQKVMAELRK